MRFELPTPTILPGSPTLITLQITMRVKTPTVTAIMVYTGVATAGPPGPAGRTARTGTGRGRGLREMLVRGTTREGGI